MKQFYLIEFISRLDEVSLKESGGSLLQGHQVTLV